MNSAKKVCASNPLDPFGMLQRLVDTVLGRRLPIVMGRSACTNGKRITLPPTIKTGTDSELVRTFFLAMHELAHNLNDSNIKGDATHRFQKLMHNFYNSFVDVCDERMFERQYPGMKDYSRIFYTDLMGEPKQQAYYTGASKKNGIVPYLKALTRYMIGRVRCEELGVTNIPTNPELVTDFDKYMADLMPQIDAMRYWRDASKLAEVFMDRVERLITDEMERKAQEKKKQEEQRQEQARKEQEKQEQERQEQARKEQEKQDNEQDNEQDNDENDGGGKEPDGVPDNTPPEGENRDDAEEGDACEEDAGEESDDEGIDEGAGIDDTDAPGNDAPDAPVPDDEEGTEPDGSDGDTPPESSDGSDDDTDAEESAPDGCADTDSETPDEESDTDSTGDDSSAGEDSSSSDSKEDERDDDDKRGEDPSEGSGHGADDNADESDSPEEGDPKEGDSSDDTDGEDNEPVPSEEDAGGEDSIASDDDELPELTDEERSAAKEEAEEEMTQLNDDDDPMNEVEDIKREIEEDFINSGEYVKAVDIVDKIVEASPASERIGVEYRDEGLRMLGPEAPQMVNLFVNNTKPHTIRFQKRGRMDFRRVNDPRDGLDVKTKKVQGGLEQSAVMLMVDYSGSMGQDCKDKIASQLTSGLLYTLDRGAVPCSAFGYTDISPYEASSVERNYPIYIEVLKSFDELYTGQVMCKCHTDHVSNCTPDLDAMREYAVPQLLLRKETNKVLLIICDGNPEAHSTELTIRMQYTYQKYIRAVKESGIKVFAFGIQSDLSRFFDKDWMYVNDTSVLGHALVDKLREYLFRKGV